jgi:hypothetical protein
MLLPRFTLLSVMRHKLRRWFYDVKRMTAISCGHRQTEHNMLRKYSHLQRLTPQGVQSISTAFPPEIHRRSTGNPQRFTQCLRMESAANPRVFRIFCTRICAPVFLRFLRRISEAFSRRGRKEKWRKASGGGGSAEKWLFRCTRSRFPQPLQVVVRFRMHTKCGTWNRGGAGDERADGGQAILPVRF